MSDFLIEHYKDSFLINFWSTAADSAPMRSPFQMTLSY